MEEYSTVKAKAGYDLRQIQELLTQFVTTKGPNALEKLESIELMIKERIETTQTLVDSLRSLSGDSDAKQIISEFDYIKEHFNKLVGQRDSLPKLTLTDMVGGKEVQTEVKEGDANVCEYNLSKRKQKGIFGDFGYSLIPTFCVCFLFAIVWTQYAKTH